MITNSVLARLEQAGYDIENWYYRHQQEGSVWTAKMIVIVGSNELRSVDAFLDDVSPFGDLASCVLVKTTKKEKKRWKLEYAIWPRL